MVSRSVTGVATEGDLGEVRVERDVPGLAPADAAALVADVLADEAVAFVAGLQRAFGARRSELLDNRARRRAALAAGGSLDFLPERPRRRAQPAVPAASRRPREGRGPARRRRDPR
jgi:malate synthase